MTQPFDSVGDLFDRAIEIPETEFRRLLIYQMRTTAAAITVIHETVNQLAKEVNELANVVRTLNEQRTSNHGSFITLIRDVEIMDKRLASVEAKVRFVSGLVLWGMGVVGTILGGLGLAFLTGAIRITR